MNIFIGTTTRFTKIKVHIKSYEASIHTYALFRHKNVHAMHVQFAKLYFSLAIQKKYKQSIFLDIIKSNRNVKNIKIIEYLHLIIYLNINIPPKRIRTHNYYIYSTITKSITITFQSTVVIGHKI